MKTCLYFFFPLFLRQFLIQTPTSLQPCNWRPVFVNDTPAEGAQIVVKAGDSLDMKVYATNLMNPNAT